MPVTQETPVSSLADLLPKNTSVQVQTRLSNVQVSEDGARITVTEDHFEEETNPKRHVFQLDEISEQAVARHLKLPYKYLKECPGDLKAININRWLEKYDDTEAVFHLTSGEIEQVYSPERILVPRSRVAEVVTKVFEPTDTIVGFHSDENQMMIDVTTQRHMVNVPGNGVGDRPDNPQVDDITSAGVRIWVPADLKSKKPVVSSHLYRLICSNGMVMPEKHDEIVLKGKTLDDIMEEMEEHAEYLLGGLDKKLEDYKQTAEMKLPGNALAFIHQIGKERKVSERVLNKAMDFAAGQSDREWTLFDVIQLFTSFADSVPFAQMRNLQDFGGFMISHSQQVMDRCSSCEQLLPHALH